MSKNTRLKARIVVLFLLLVLPVSALDAIEACDCSRVGGADESRVDASWLVVGIGDRSRRGVVT
jgi:hypothetical protein